MWAQKEEKRALIFIHSYTDIHMNTHIPKPAQSPLIMTLEQRLHVYAICHDVAKANEWLEVKKRPAHHLVVDGRFVVVVASWHFALQENHQTLMMLASVWLGLPPSFRVLLMLMMSVASNWNDETESSSPPRQSRPLSTSRVKESKRTAIAMEVPCLFFCLLSCYSVAGEDVPPQNEIVSNSPLRPYLTTIDRLWTTCERVVLDLDLSCKQWCTHNFAAPDKDAPMRVAVYVV